MKSLSMQVDGPPRGRGGLKGTWMEVVTMDLKKCNLSDDLAQNMIKIKKQNSYRHVANTNIVGTSLMTMMSSDGKSPSGINATMGGLILK